MCWLFNLHSFRLFCDSDLTPRAEHNTIVTCRVLEIEICKKGGVNVKGCDQLHAPIPTDVCKKDGYNDADTRINKIT